MVRQEGARSPPPLPRGPRSPFGVPSGCGGRGVGRGGQGGQGQRNAQLQGGGDTHAHRRMGERWSFKKRLCSKIFVILEAFTSFLPPSPLFCSLSLSSPSLGNYMEKSSFFPLFPFRVSSFLSSSFPHPFIMSQLMALSARWGWGMGSAGREEKNIRKKEVGVETAFCRRKVWCGGRSVAVAAEERAIRSMPSPITEERLLAWDSSNLVTVVFCHFST